jgi:hypothetical protein
LRTGWSQNLPRPRPFPYAQPSSELGNEAEGLTHATDGGQSDRGPQETQPQTLTQEPSTSVGHMPHLHRLALAHQVSVHR